MAAAVLTRSQLGIARRESRCEIPVRHLPYTPPLHSRTPADARGPRSRGRKRPACLEREPAPSARHSARRAITRQRDSHAVALSSRRYDSKPTPVRRVRTRDLILPPLYFPSRRDNARVALRSRAARMPSNFSRRIRCVKVFTASPNDRYDVTNEASFIIFSARRKAQTRIAGEGKRLNSFLSI